MQFRLRKPASPLPSPRKSPDPDFIIGLFPLKSSTRPWPLDHFFTLLCKNRLNPGHSLVMSIRQFIIRLPNYPATQQLSSYRIIFAHFDQKQPKTACFRRFRRNNSYENPCKLHCKCLLTFSLGLDPLENPKNAKKFLLNSLSCPFSLTASPFPFFDPRCFQQTLPRNPKIRGFGPVGGAGPRHNPFVQAAPSPSPFLLLLLPIPTTLVYNMPSLPGG